MTAERRRDPDSGAGPRPLPGRRRARIVAMRLVVFGLVTAVAVIGLTSAIAVRSVQQWAIFALLAAAWLASTTSCVLVLRGLRAERRSVAERREGARPTDR